MDPDDRFEVLRKLLPQDRHGDASVRHLADQTCELEFPAGSTLVRDGQPATDSWLVISGRIEIRQQSGRRWVAAAGDLVDPTEGALRGVTVIGARVLEPTTVLAIPLVQPDGG